MHVVLQNRLFCLSTTGGRGQGMAVLTLRSWLPWQCRDWRKGKPGKGEISLWGLSGQGLAVKAVPPPQTEEGQLGVTGAAPPLGTGHLHEEQIEASPGHGPGGGASGPWLGKAMAGTWQVWELRGALSTSLSLKASPTKTEGSPLRLSTELFGEALSEPPSRSFFQGYLQHCLCCWSQSAVLWEGGDSGVWHWPLFLEKWTHCVLMSRLTTEQIK